MIIIVRRKFKLRLDGGNCIGVKLTIATLFTQVAYICRKSVKGGRVVAAIYLLLSLHYHENMYM